MCLCMRNYIACVNREVMYESVFKLVKFLYLCVWEKNHVLYERRKICVRVWEKIGQSVFEIKTMCCLHVWVWDKNNILFTCVREGLCVRANLHIKVCVKEENCVFISMRERFGAREKGREHSCLNKKKNWVFITILLYRVLNILKGLYH